MPVSEPGFLGGDRTSIDLPAPEEALVEAVQATGKPLAVVLMNGSALAVNWINEHANAVLEAWYPGEEGGAAIAETLSGKNNPAGRLPVTFYTGVNQLPNFEDYQMAGRTYRYFKGKPLYPFGYGLSYTTFSYSDLSVPTQLWLRGNPSTPMSPSPTPARSPEMRPSSSISNSLMSRVRRRSRSADSSAFIWKPAPARRFTSN